MFKYVSNVSELAHDIIDRYISEKNIAIDATLGNGYDCDFLKERFQKVFAFDIQKCCCDQYNSKGVGNVSVINDSHAKFNAYIDEKVNCIIYNLGFLPGGDKSITTESDSTIESVRQGLNLLKSNGLMIIAVYRGHYQGVEEEGNLRKFLSELPKNLYGVMEHNVINRAKGAPLLLVVEKK